MAKTILITGSTDGIGLETAKSLIADGHNVILHGRNADKLAKVQKAIGRKGEGYVADLSSFHGVKKLAEAILQTHNRLDVLINNAGIFKTPNPITQDSLDIRFMVNTIAPYLLTQKLLPLLGTEARVVNLSSAAQAPVTLNALSGHVFLSDMEAYAQSKLALTMWTAYLAQRGIDPMIIAVNPGSFLASKMVREGFGQSGNDLKIGVDILKRAALSDEFSNASGRYFDNDAGQFSPPHSAGQDMTVAKQLVEKIEGVIRQLM